MARKRSGYRSYSYWGYGDYTPRPTATERAHSAAKAAAILLKKGQKLTPVHIEGRLIAATFWGREWCQNLERYSDYASRLPRGRSYVRGGSVIDLQIAPGKVSALVQGSDLYEVKIDVVPVSGPQWKAIVAECSGKIDSVVELLSGKLSASVMEVMTKKGAGLLPAPSEIKLECSCPDWATMCKHVAAVLYGVGARLDHQPELLFELRSASPIELVTSAAGGGILRGKARSGARALATSDLSSVFGIDLDDAPPPAKTLVKEAETPPLPTPTPLRKIPKPATTKAPSPRFVGIPKPAPAKAASSRFVGIPKPAPAKVEALPSAAAADLPNLEGHSRLEEKFMDVALELGISNAERLLDRLRSKVKELPVP